MRYLLSVFFTLVFIIPLQANNPIFEHRSKLAIDMRIDELIFAGLEDMYYLKFDDATSYFRKAQTEYPNDPKGFFYESLILFHTAMASRDEKIYDQYISSSEKVIEKCDDLLDKNDNNIEALFYKGQTYSYRSLLLLSLNKSLLSAASDGNSGYRILSEITERDPTFNDAYMGLGLYKIAISFVPEKFQWLMSIIGFDGDLKEGRGMLSRSRNNGKFTKVESQVYLAIFSLREREEDNGETERMLKELTEKYPESPLFRLFYANILQQMGKNDDAIAQANLSLELNTHSLQNEIMKGANFVLGMSYFRKNDFDNAAKYFEEHLKHVNYEDRYNISLFHLGIAYEMTGQRDRALKYYREAREDFIDERDGEAEKIFLKYSRKLIDKPMNEFDMSLLKAMNLRYDSKYTEALQILNNILASDKVTTLNDNDKIRLYSETGHTHVYSGNDDLAIDYFTRCTKLDPDLEKWMIPHAYFELGKIYTRKGNKEKANEMFDKIYDYGDYDLRSLLEIRLNSYINS